MTIEALSHEGAIIALGWRNARLDALRTPHPLTTQQQHEWFINKEGRWFQFREDGQIIGYGGIEHIQWENRLGELSLLMAPEHTDKRGEALDMILERAFGNVNLKAVFAEVYSCNEDFGWWWRSATARNAYANTIPYRKYYGGEYHWSTVFTFEEGEYAASRNVD